MAPRPLPRKKNAASAVCRYRDPFSVLGVHSGVRQQTVSFGGVIVIITKMRIFDFGGGVDAGDGVDFVPVTALAAVILEAAGYAVGLGKQHNIVSRYYTCRIDKQSRFK